MKKFQCPSCGGELLFQSNVSVSVVCSYCNSLIVRRDVNVDIIGKMAALPDDMSPLMLGASGTYRGTRFRIIGRMKMGWKHGSWNEWHIFMENGGKGWLAEAQGFYAVAFEFKGELIAETQKTITGLGLPRPDLSDHSNKPLFVPEDKVNIALLGHQLYLGQQKYKIVDIKEAVCFGSEGELPFISKKGRTILTIDLLGHHGEFANVEINHDETRIYLGHYVEWRDLSFQQTRPLEGW
jgi:Domain of unknown function (DUF4178)